jgi:hypothetical protein
VTEKSADTRAIPDAISDLWIFYGEHAAQARQHETLRAAITTLLAGFAATIVGTVADDGFQDRDILSGLLVMALGVVGALLSLKHYERNRFHTKVLDATRTEIERLRSIQPASVGVASPKGLRTAAKQRHAEVFSPPWAVAIRLFALWLALPILIALAGAAIVALSLL